MFYYRKISVQKKAIALCDCFEKFFHNKKKKLMDLQYRNFVKQMVDYGIVREDDERVKNVLCNDNF